MSDEQQAKRFDPTAHLTKIKTRGKGDMPYLQVKHRLMWMHSMVEKFEILTEITSDGPDFARFKATVIADGDIATGHGSETAQDFPDFFEKAETKAIGRALAALGFGTDAAPEFDDGEPADGLAAAKAEKAYRRDEPAAPLRQAQPAPQYTPVPQPAPRPAPGAVTRYENVAPRGTDLQKAQELLQGYGVDAIGLSYGDTIKAAQAWVKRTFGADARVIGTGDVKPGKEQYGPSTTPWDIYNYIAHFGAAAHADQVSGANRAVLAAGGGIPDYDDVPFD